MSTIPPYLYATYSIKDQESDARRLITSVVVEEMLHLTLTTNLLLALGGEPDFGPSLTPRYPSLLAHHKPDLRLELQRCTPEVIRSAFMVIERPEKKGAQPQADNFETLGQFYLALEEGLHRMSGDHDLFANHQPERQLADSSMYGPVAFDAADSGGLMLIHDLDSACRALEIIIDQGEGVGDEKWADPAHLELTHYYKFVQLADGTVPIGDTWPVVDTPQVADLSPEIRPVADLFNAVYRLVFITMESMFKGGADQGAVVGGLYRLMSDCMTPIAQDLVAMPIDAQLNAGPTFEIYEFSGDPWTETVDLARLVASTWRTLAPVEATLRAMRAPE